MGHGSIMRHQSHGSPEDGEAVTYASSRTPRRSAASLSLSNLARARSSELHPICSTRPSSRNNTASCEAAFRSEEHTSELQSLMRISYAVFCLNKKKHNLKHYTPYTN